MGVMKMDMPMQFGLLAGGAAMLDPRGTGGNTGSAINKGMQAGLGTMLPLMQWQQNKKDRKEDRDWNKSQDMIRNVLAERQFKMRKDALEGEAENRDARTNIARSQYNLQKDKMAYDIKLLEQQNRAMSDFSTRMIQGLPGGAGQSGYTAAGGDPANRTEPGAHGQAQPVSERMTDEQVYQYASQAIAGGAKPQAVKALIDSRGPSTDPSSPMFDRSAWTSSAVQKEAKRRYDNKEFTTMEEAVIVVLQDINAKEVGRRQYGTARRESMSQTK